MPTKNKHELGRLAQRNAQVSETNTLIADHVNTATVDDAYKLGYDVGFKDGYEKGIDEATTPPNIVPSETLPTAGQQL